MTRTTVRQFAMMTGLIAATVGLRLYFRTIPNFAPVAAVALFAGYYFQSRRMAVAVPVISMLITDRVLGGYQPALMITVYGLLAMPVMMRSWLRRRFEVRHGSALTATFGLTACVLMASFSFFAVTNLMTWMVTPWYPRSVVGLVECYVSALPFFRYTLAGDMVFGTTLFGCYAAIRMLRSSSAPGRSAVALSKS